MMNRIFLFDSMDLPSKYVIANPDWPHLCHDHRYSIIVHETVRVRNYAAAKTAEEWLGERYLVEMTYAVFAPTAEHMNAVNRADGDVFYVRQSTQALPKQMQYRDAEDLDLTQIDHWFARWLLARKKTINEVNL